MEGVLGVLRELLGRFEATSLTTGWGSVSSHPQCCSWSGWVFAILEPLVMLVSSASCDQVLMRWLRR